MVSSIICFLENAGKIFYMSPSIFILIIAAQKTNDPQMAWPLLSFTNKFQKMSSI